MTSETRQAATSLTDYYSGAQLRIDRWTALKSSTARLAESSGARNREKLIQKARSLIATLEPIEMYWAFPGRHAFDELRVLLAEERYGELARRVRAS